MPERRVVPGPVRRGHLRYVWRRTEGTFLCGAALRADCSPPGTVKVEHQELSLHDDLSPLDTGSERGLIRGVKAIKGKRANEVGINPCQGQQGALAGTVV